MFTDGFREKKDLIVWKKRIIKVCYSNFNIIVRDAFMKCCFIRACSYLKSAIMLVNTRLIVGLPLFPSGPHSWCLRNSATLKQKKKEAKAVNKQVLFSLVFFCEQLLLPQQRRLSNLIRTTCRSSKSTLRPQ